MQRDKQDEGVPLDDYVRMPALYQTVAFIVATVLLIIYGMMSVAVLRSTLGAVGGGKP